MRRKKLFNYTFIPLVILVLSLFVPAAGSAAKAVENRAEQDTILEELRKEIKENGYLYTVDYNDTCQYPLDQLCGFRPELAFGDDSSSYRQYLIALSPISHRVIADDSSSYRQYLDPLLMMSHQVYNYGFSFKSRRRKKGKGKYDTEFFCFF